MKELYIIRHGETDFNKLGIVQGRGVNADLNKEGRVQAAKFYEAYKHVPFDKLYTSTLKRTHQTIEPFISAGFNWEQHEGLDELDWGDYEGRESTYKLKQHFYSITQDWALGKLHVRTPKGENPLEVHERQKHAITHILSRTEEQRVLICMHGRALRLLLCYLTGKDLSQMDTFPHQNLSLYRLRFNGEAFKLLDFNNTEHLAAMDALERRTS